MKNNRKNHHRQSPKIETPACFYSSQYEYRQLNTAQLQSNQGYQRAVDPNHVKRIVDHFDPMYLDEILVSSRDGYYYVIDGQNRIAAFKHMNGGKDCLVNCKIFRGLTYEQEADMFCHLDAIKKKLRYCQSIQARTEAKNDTVIVAITDILSAYGIKWSFRDAGPNTDSTIKASKVLVDTYEELGPQMFELVIRLLTRTWNGHAGSMSAQFIKGLSLFVKVYVHDADEDVFVKKLSGITPAEVKSLARAEVSASNNRLKYASVFWRKYNYRSANKLDYRLES